MIPYEELVAALDGYVARGRAPLAQSERAAPIAIGTAAPSGRAAAAPAFVPPSPSRPQAPPPMHSEEVDLGYDEAHDPDLPPLGGQHEEDSTHVGAMPTTSPPRHHHEEHGDEIDIGDVLTDDEV
jgi:hypothetical protein